MTKEELIQLLKDYKENKACLNICLKRLKNKRAQLKEYEDTDTPVTATLGINQDIHSKNKISDKVAKKVVQNDFKRIEIKVEIKEFEDKVKDLRSKVEAVEDRLIGLKYKEREILVAYYIDGRTAEDIGNKLYLDLFNQTRSIRHIQRIIDRATDKLLNF